MYPAVKNAIVVMLDSLQYNYLHCNGNDWIKTPNLDRFGREGIIFDECYIEGVPTIPCRRAMHTGRYTLPVAGWVPLSMEDTTIADLCWGSNIDTAMYFDSGPQRIPKFGYTRGFDKVYFLHGHEGDHMFYKRDDLIHLDPTDYLEDTVAKKAPALIGQAAIDSVMGELDGFSRHRQYWKTDEDQNVARLLKESVKYLENVDRNKPFFLWIDSFDPHEPWDSPSVYDPEMKCPYNPDYKGKDMYNPPMGLVDGLFTEEEMHHVRMLYAEKVTMCDKWFGHFMDNCKRLGLEKDTLFLVVSDHGEPLGNAEHGHGIMRKCRPWPYEELVHGVCMLKAPGVKANQRSKAFVQSCDVAPTICDWLGLGVRDFHQGKSLLPIARGEVTKVRDFAIAGYHKYSWSIITEDWSYIHWTKNDRSDSHAVNADLLYDMYGKDTMAHMDGILPKTHKFSLGGKTKEEAEYAAAATTDGEDQWTCTPAASSEVPQKDELYSRKNDRFQLKNVIDSNKDTAKKLWDELREFMGYLKTC